ncbi:putative bifunctional diguanylate cyclase/phosphodiesterase [Solidesulfovibrio fructosivorans]|uniref:putative bifunctional diguanylate cyclase/phosphodiesterase n=1 Tax=Solidesulfovibrio fructosivorans TaxID=878 RepID=UPI0002ECB7E9|nr:EAL domain-containing protein [Solidesulfovibrio fructosivorans]
MIAHSVDSPCPGRPETENALGGAAPSILVVEDERIVALDLKVILKRLGYVLAGVTASGTEAVDLCDALRPDLVLMDIFLKGDMDGVDAACVIQSECDVPVIFLTSHTDQVTLQRAKRTAPYGYVLKPVDENWLRTAVEVAIFKHRTEQKLKRSEQRYRHLFSGMLNAFLLLELSPCDACADGRGALRILEANPSFERMTGLCRSEVIDRALTEVFPGIEPFWLDTLGETARSGRSVRFENSLADCDMFFLAQAYSPQSGQVAVVLEDVTERKSGEERLRYQSFHDALTGLPNRALCLDRIARAIERARRRSNYLYALLFLDIDRFRLVNDSLGHLFGDELLKRVGERLRHEVPQLDTVARVGGDEFVLLVEEIAASADALHIVKAVRERFRTPFVIAKRQFYVTASMGVVLGPADYERPEELMQNAAIAMNEARKSGWGRVRVFEWSMRQRAERVMDLETNLRLALDHREFILHYQPIFDLKTLAPCGVEALVRWRRPTGELVPPDEFIPAAEQSGLIIPLGAMVLAEACRAMGRLRRGGLGGNPFFMSVNLSARQFTQPELVKQVVRTLRDERMAPGDLKLEITESVLMEHPESAMLKLRGLREFGVGIGIDDFGTGYSSLAYLQRFPIDTLKVDRGFVSGMDEYGNRVIVRSIIGLAHSLGCDVVAEGIETESQLRDLAGLGCDLGQGFFYARPMDEAALTSFLGKEEGARGETL